MSSQPDGRPHRRISRQKVAIMVAAVLVGTLNRPVRELVENGTVEQGTLMGSGGALVLCLGLVFVFVRYTNSRTPESK